MSKSTPISQLPGQSHEQYIENNSQMRVVQALQNSPPPPQNTQAPDINDDDLVVQDILNSMAEPTVPSTMTYDPNNLSNYRPKSNDFGEMLSMPPQPTTNADLMIANLAQRQAAMENLSFRHYITVFASDIKLACIAFFVVIAVHFIPFEKYLSKYIAVDRIPHHEIVIRALIAAVSVIAIKRFVMKI